MSKNIDSEWNERLKKLIGQNLRKIRKEKKISQIEMCEILGIARTTISNIENGKQFLSCWQLLLLRDKFDIQLDKLIPHLADICIIEEFVFKEDIVTKEKVRITMLQIQKAKEKIERLTKDLHKKTEYKPDTLFG